jgi:hypothetical protein
MQSTSLKSQVRSGIQTPHQGKQKGLHRFVDAALQSIYKM